jgi:uncharacterized membrane protein
VIGDEGINARVKAGFWDEVKSMLEKHFNDGKFTEGLVKGILLTGLQLKEHFPHRKNDINELPDDISFDDPALTGMV